jgi:PAS domain S-box-containing protein
MTAEYFALAATAQLVIDPQCDRVLAANREAGLLFGHGSEALCSDRVSRLFAPDFVALLLFTDELICRGRAWSDQLQVTTATGIERVEVSGTCTAHADGQQLFLSLQLAEELARRRDRADAQRHYQSGIGHWNSVSRVFQEFERQNQLLLDAAGEGIYGVDASGVTTFVNPAAERILGYSAAELAGRNMHAAIHHRHADGSTFCVEDCPIFAAFHDGTVHTVEDDVFWSRDGERIDVEYTSTPVRDNGMLVGAVVIFRDISQKKADRRQLLAALKEVEQLKNRLELENAYLQEEINSEFNHHRIVGKSAAVQNIVRQIELVAPSDATVLICGESGTGKELIARAIHEMSSRSQRSLIRVNCAAIPADLFESEFFGHMRGAFTGATADRPGRFELADGGTLFLDEVGEIPLLLQGKLLRVLQEQQFERVGEARTRKVNVRIIAATNRNLKASVMRGEFREDLFYRLNVFPIEAVPLRQRRDDIAALTQHFVTRACSRANKPALKIPLSELEKLTSYHWPGNIRELENVIERQVILARGEALRFDGLTASLPPVSATPEEAGTGKPLYTETELRSVQRRNLLLALEKCQGKVFGAGGAAELLAMKPTTMASQLKKFRIDAAQFRNARRELVTT